LVRWRQGKICSVNADWKRRFDRLKGLDQLCEDSTLQPSYSVPPSGLQAIPERRYTVLADYALTTTT